MEFHTAFAFIVRLAFHDMLGKEVCSLFLTLLQK